MWRWRRPACGAAQTAGERQSPPARCGGPVSPSHQVGSSEEGVPFMLKKVAFTMYPFRDVARARRFYEETLGLKVGLNGNRGDQWWIEYDLPGGGCFALTNFIPDEPSARAGGTIA